MNSLSLLDLRRDLVCRGNDHDLLTALMQPIPDDGARPCAILGEKACLSRATPVDFEGVNVEGSLPHGDLEAWIPDTEHQLESEARQLEQRLLRRVRTTAKAQNQLLPRATMRSAQACFLAEPLHMSGRFESASSFAAGADAHTNRSCVEQLLYSE